jgi:hypothetical protein
LSASREKPRLSPTSIQPQTLQQVPRNFSISVNVSAKNQTVWIQVVGKIVNITLPLGTFLQSGIGRPCFFLYIPLFPKSTKEKDL